METLKKICKLLNENKEYVLINTARNATETMKEIGKDYKEREEKKENKEA